MTRLKLDQIQFCSEVDSYINYDTKTASMNVSGSVVNLGQATFSVSIPYSNPRTKADVYAKNLNTNIKMAVGSPRVHPYTYASFEIARLQSSYNGTNITVTLTITNNTGGTINLVAQTIEISAVLVEVPISS